MIDCTLPFLARSISLIMHPIIINGKKSSKNMSILGDNAIQFVIWLSYSNV